MPIDWDFENFQLELKKFFEVLDEFNGSFNRSFCLMKPDFNNIQIDMFWKVFFQVVKVIDFIERKIKNDFLQLFEFRQGLRNHVHFDFLKVVIFEVQVNLLEVAQCTNTET